MSFLSRHIADESNSVDPVAGKGSPHHGAQHHELPEPATDPAHRVIGTGQRETEYQHQEFPRMVYHTNHDPVVVEDAESLRVALRAGWTLTPPQKEK